MPYPNNDDQLTRLGRELTEGNWLANAQRRTRRRKSLWNLLLPLLGFPLWGAIAFTVAWIASSLHGALHPGLTSLFHSGPLSLGQALVLFPSLIGAICPAFILTNVLVYLIPPARRAMDKEARDYPGTDFVSSQRALRNLGLMGLAICAPLIVTGAILA